MKKRIFLLLLLLTLGGHLHIFAQQIGGGLLAGVNLSTMKLSNNDSTRFLPGFTGGIRIALIPKRSNFGAEIDLIYARQGTSMKTGHDEEGNRVKYMTKTSYLNMPLLLNFYFNKWDDAEDESQLIRLRVGPQIGFCFGGNDIKSVEGKQKKQYITRWERGSFNRIDYGITAAIAVWYVELRYTFGLNNVLKENGLSTNHVISIVWSDIW